MFVGNKVKGRAKELRQRLQNLSLRTKVSVGSAVMLASSSAVADPISDLIDQIDLGAVATAVAGVAVIIVTIALAMKAPAVVKRLVNKV